MDSRMSASAGAHDALACASSLHSISPLGEHSQPPRPSLGPQACPAFGFTRFLVIFPPPHLFFDATPLDEFAKSANRLLQRFPVPDQ